MNENQIAVAKNFITCKNCGSEELSIINRSDTIEFRGLNLDVDGLKYTFCNKCKIRTESTEQAEHNFSTIKIFYSQERDRIRVKDGMLSGECIAEIRKSFSLNQREAAVIFGGGFNAFNKYESGEVLQSSAMDRLLRLSKHFGLPAIKALHEWVLQTKPEFKLATIPSGRNLFETKISVVVEQSNQATAYLRIENPDGINQILNYIGSADFLPDALQNSFIGLEIGNSPSNGTPIKNAKTLEKISNNLYFTEV